MFSVSGAHTFVSSAASPQTINISSGYGSSGRMIVNGSLISNGVNIPDKLRELEVRLEILEDGAKRTYQRSCALLLELCPVVYLSADVRGVIDGYLGNHAEGD